MAFNFQLILVCLNHASFYFACNSAHKRTFNSHGRVIAVVYLDKLSADNEVKLFEPDKVDLLALLA